jgi:hypothetical protein
MKYCPSCGKQWVNEANFCAHCGFKRPFANEGKKDGNKEENNVNQDNAASNTEKEVIQNSIADLTSETSAEKNTYKSSLIKEKDKKSPQNTSKQINFLKGKKPLLISIVFLLIVGISSFLFIANNNKPKLSAKEKKEVLETYKAYKEAQDYIKENGYEDELTKEENAQNENINSETASEEPSTQDNLNTGKTENIENSSTTEDSEGENNSVTIEGTWNYPEKNQVYEISFSQVDDVNGLIKIKSQEISEDLPFQITNYSFEDGKLEINLENGEKWTLQRNRDDLYIWKDDGSNMVLKVSRTK